MRKEIKWSNENDAELSLTVSPLFGVSVRINDNNSGIASFSVPDEIIDDMIEFLQKAKK